MEMKDIENFYKEVYPKKVKVVTYILKGDSVTAEDVVQEAFTRMIKYKHVFNEGEAGLETWFNSIMFNVLWDIRRQNLGLSGTITESMSDEDGMEYNKLQSPEYRQFLLRSLNKVKNAKHKKVLQLFFLFGYSSREISDMGLEISQTNVTTIVNRFREDLK